MRSFDYIKISFPIDFTIVITKKLLNMNIEY